MTFHEDLADWRKVVIKSPMPVVWGHCVGGEFWWDVRNDRWCMSNDPHVIDLYVGTYCDAHKQMEGMIIGTTMKLNEALAWIAGGPRPHGASVH